jgi:prostaglandin reductase 1
MRVYTQRLPIGSTMIGSQVAKIIESKHSKFPIGKRIVGYMGWRSHTVLNPDALETQDIVMTEKPYLIPDFGDLSNSLALGVLGMPG